MMYLKNLHGQPSVGLGTEIANGGLWGEVDPGDYAWDPNPLKTLTQLWPNSINASKRLERDVPQFQFPTSSHGPQQPALELLRTNNDHENTIAFEAQRAEETGAIMPTRKSDGRRSDVSVARFVLADEENDNSAMVAEPPAPEPAEPSVSGSTPAAQSQTADKRDKEKNKEKESDNLTIEVRQDS